MASSDVAEASSVGRDGAPIATISAADLDGPIPVPSSTPVPDKLVTPAMASAVDDSAFSDWRDALARTVALESRALLDGVIDLQREFDDASQYIRGDFAWRKQVAAFHDRTNDVVTARMEALGKQLQQSTQSLDQSLAKTLRSKDAVAKDEMRRQVSMYEDKLRRTRTALKKEVDRFTLLEKCLRKEETRQAKATYERLVEQLTLEHAAKEAALHGLLQELKLSYVTIENANTQLMEAVKSRGEEIERLKKMLPKASVTNQRGINSARPVSAAPPPTAVATAATDAHMHTLKQSLSLANTTVDSLRLQIDEANAEKNATLKKARHAEDTTAKITEELTKVKHLLSESHSALITNRKEMEVLLQEKTHWKELYTDLHFQSSSHKHELDDSNRFAAAAQSRLDSVEKQLLQSSNTLTTGVVAASVDRWTQWRQEAKDEAYSEGIVLVDAFVDQTRRAFPGHLSSNGDLAVDAETKLRFEFEKKYSDMLNIRISHERKRVITRIEMLWNKRACDAKLRSTRGTVVNDGRRSMSKPVSSLAVDKSPQCLPLKHVLELVLEAFQDLGFSEWDSTDIDALSDQLVSLRELLSAQEHANKALQEHIEAQAMCLAKTDLQLREKELLLAELTDRCRNLRSQMELLSGERNDAALPFDLSGWDKSDPFTVYGQSQPIVEKRKAVRARPVSASATLVHHEKSPASISLASTYPLHSAQEATTVKNRMHDQHPPLKPFLLNHLPVVDTTNLPSTYSRTPQQLEDHVRSVLKADLLNLTPAENQLDDGSHVGIDGIIQIMQRRRSRK